MFAPYQHVRMLIEHGERVCLIVLATDTQQSSALALLEQRSLQQAMSAAHRDTQGALLSAYAGPQCVIAIDRDDLARIDELRTDAPSDHGAESCITQLAVVHLVPFVADATDEIIA